ncbi:MAG: ATPase, partial [Nanoarchaeota archaeon]
MTPDIKLKVAEALQDDVNRGVVRLDSAVMRQIGVSAGEPVGIRGERETVAIVDRAYPSDLGLGILRMDGVIRKNAKIGVGEQVSVFKPELKEAQKVSLAPLQEFEPHPATLVSIKKGLMKKPVVSGDIITLG